MKLPKPGPDPFNRAVFKNCRDTYFGGAEVVVGKGKNARSHMAAESLGKSEHAAAVNSAGSFLSWPPCI